MHNTFLLLGDCNTKYNLFHLTNILLRNESRVLFVKSNCFSNGKVIKINKTRFVLSIILKLNIFVFYAHAMLLIHLIVIRSEHLIIFICF